MNKGQKTALRLLELRLNPVPVILGTKDPERKGHTDSISKEDITKYKFNELGISTGYASNNLEAIDFDLKNADDPKDFMKKYDHYIGEELRKKLVIQKTPSGGFHYLYRCEEISSSKKLCNNKEGKAIVETRGIGSYVKCFPSDGYTMIQGTFADIPYLSIDERFTLIVAAKRLSQTLLKESRKRISDEENKYLKKFPDYNSDPEIGINLLLDHGWTIFGDEDDKTEWVNFTRPDSDSFQIHAGYNKDSKFFFCFSTAQDIFEANKPYNNHAIFAELECGGNYKKAYGKLNSLGFGSKEADDSEDFDSLSFLSDSVDENGYLEQARKGEVNQGLSLGWNIDEYFLLKPNSFNMGLGYDNVGKSVFMLALAMASNVLHDWKWGMVMPENKTGMSRRRLLEIKTGKNISYFNDKKDLFDQYLGEIRNDFKIVANKKHYTIKDVIEMGKRLYEYFGVNALLIDPYNFFKVEGDGYSHNNEILSELRVFSEEYCSVYVMAHPSSFAPRNKKNNDGYLSAPSKYDIQGGADFPYRVDDFFILHRIVNHPDPDIKKTMQFIVEKIKETETGGKPHPQDRYSELIYEQRDGFLGYWDTDGRNPMYEALMSKMGIQKEIKRLTAEEAFAL